MSRESIHANSASPIRSRFKIISDYLAAVGEAPCLHQLPQRHVHPGRQHVPARGLPLLPRLKVARQRPRRGGLGLLRFVLSLGRCESLEKADERLGLRVFDGKRQAVCHARKYVPKALRFSCSCSCSCSWPLGPISNPCWTSAFMLPPTNASPAAALARAMTAAG